MRLDESPAALASSCSTARLIAHAAESYQYAFTLESVLNLPDDLPGELRIHGRAPVDARPRASMVCLFCG